MAWQIRTSKKSQISFAVPICGVPLLIFLHIVCKFYEHQKQWMKRKKRSFNAHKSNESSSALLSTPSSICLCYTQSTCITNAMGKFMKCSKCDVKRMRSIMARQRMIKGFMCIKISVWERIKWAYCIIYKMWTHTQRRRRHALTCSKFDLFSCRFRIKRTCSENGRCLQPTEHVEWITRNPTVD